MQVQTPVKYYEEVKELVDIVEAYGGRVHDGATADAADADNPMPVDVGEQEAWMKDRFLGALVILNANRSRYGALMDDLANNFSCGNNEYPKSAVAAHNLLLTYKGQPTNTNRQRNNNSGRGPSGGRGGGACGDGRGGGCRANGRDGGRNGGRFRAGRVLTQHAFSLAMIEQRINNSFPDGIPETYVLLDSDSNISIFRSAHFLTDIRYADSTLLLQSNGGGSQETCQQGTLAGFGTVWYNPESVANILSLADVRRVHRVTMDSAVQPAFLVHREDGTAPTVFGEHESGLYLHNVNDGNSNEVNKTVTAYFCLHTVAENKTKSQNRNRAGKTLAGRL